MDGVKMLAAGEQGLVVEFGNTINADVNARVHHTAQLIRRDLAQVVLEVVPTYRSLLVYFNPFCIKRTELVERIEQLLPESGNLATGNFQAKVVHIPVCYGHEYGPDLPFVASHNGLSEEEVVTIHTSIPYLVYMIGFTPGFPYLGGMSEKIATPRLSQPRKKIPAGSVGIAGSQTGLYPIESPGGWQLVGRTPIRAFNPKAEKPFLFDAGNYLQFVAISTKEYAAIERDVDNGTYIPVVSDLKGGCSQ